MARSTTSSEQPSPPFYRGQRVTKHNHHDVTQVNAQVTDAVTQAAVEMFVVRPSPGDGIKLRIALPALSL